METAPGPSERGRKLDALIHELAHVKALHTQSLEAGIPGEGYDAGVRSMRDFVRGGRLDEALLGLRELKMQILCQILLQEPFRDVQGAFLDIDAGLGFEGDRGTASPERRVSPPRGPAPSNSED